MAGVEKGSRRVSVGYLWTGNELADCERAFGGFIASFGEQGNGVVHPLPKEPIDLARAAFIAGWQAHQQ